MGPQEIHPTNNRAIVIILQIPFNVHVHIQARYIHHTTTIQIKKEKQKKRKKKRNKTFYTNTVGMNGKRQMITCIKGEYIVMMIHSVGMRNRC